MGVKVLHGDSREVLAAMPDASVDAVVTDPPYELGFMGKAWDSVGVAYDVRLWAEVLRVLKPGGHLLAFGGTRTYHRMACAIEDVGFEVRDSLHWLYGSGFPKSLDVSKAIDKQRHDLADVRKVCRWLRACIDASPETVRSIAEHFGFHPRMVEHWAARDTDSQPTVPKWDQWEQLRSLLNFGDEMDAEVWRLNGRKGQPGEAWSDREVTGTVDEWADRTNYALTSRDGLRRDNPATDAARQWSGWGTALKPAHEPIVVARKPLVGTVSGNVLAHGTGALNIDGCRVGFASEADEQESKAKNQHADFGTEPGGNAVYGDYSMVPRTNYNPPGRWPANLVLTHAADCGEACAEGCPVAELDGQSGERPGATSVSRGRTGTFDFGSADKVAGYADSGGASRFFTVTEWDPIADVSPFRYVAKPSKRERNADGALSNGHPTVKPVALMRWLVRLVTPPGGTVLDPFAGSGTTLVAAVLEGFDAIGIELTDDYLPIIEGRIAWAEQQAALTPDPEPTLFDDEAQP